MVPPSKQRLLAGLIVLLTVGLLYTIWPSFQQISAPVVQVNDSAPDFTLTADGGQAVQLKDFRGKFVVLNFWATWCAPCVEELPSLNRFHSQFAGRGVVVLGVSVDEDRNTYERFLKKAGVQFMTLRDPERKVSRLYGTFKYPETYLIDGQGKVVDKVIGATDWTDERMLRHIEHLMRS